MDDTTREPDETPDASEPSDEALDPTEAGPEPEPERDIPHNEDLQDPAGDNHDLTHDQFDLGRGSRIN